MCERFNNKTSYLNLAFLTAPLGAENGLRLILLIFLFVIFIIFMRNKIERNYKLFNYMN